MSNSDLLYVSKINENFVNESEELNGNEKKPIFSISNSKEILFSNIKEIINAEWVKEDNNESNENLYFIQTAENNNKNKNNKKEKELKFTVIKQTESSEFLKKKRRRGRVKEMRNNSKEKEEKTHDKNTSDNLLKKIQVHYLSFIVNYLNDILKNLKYKQKFLNLDYNFKRNVKKEFVAKLKTKTIGEIISNKISVKYKNQDKFVNQKLYQTIKKNEVLRKILDENYTLLFRKIYFKNKNKINLSEFGINKEITFSPGIKMFKDLFKNKQQKEINDKYIFNINKCVRQNFLSDVYFISK